MLGRQRNQRDARHVPLSDGTQPVTNPAACQTRTPPPRMRRHGFTPLTSPSTAQIISAPVGWRASPVTTPTLALAGSSQGQVPRIAADRRSLRPGSTAKLLQHRERGAASAEHRPLDRRGVTMVAAHEHPLAQRNRLLGVEGRRLRGLAMRADVGPQVLPVGRARIEPASELFAHLTGDGRVQRGWSRHCGRHERSPGWRVRRRHLAHHRHVLGRAARLPIEVRRGPCNGGPGAANQQHAADREPGSGTRSPSNLWAAGPSVATTTARPLTCSPPSRITPDPSIPTTLAPKRTTPSGKVPAS